MKILPVLGAFGMSREIDERLGSKLGLIGRHAQLPAFQIVNDAHDRFLSLTSRLVGLEYGSDGEAFRSHPLWPKIEMETSGLADKLSALGSDAIRAVVLLEEIRQLDETVDGFCDGIEADHTIKPVAA